MRNRLFLETLAELKKIAVEKMGNGKHERAAGVMFAVNYMEYADLAAKDGRNAQKKAVGEAGDGGDSGDGW